ncbi:MAG TPA: phosphatase PAP2 family protein [Caulobacteraceae bacterium]|jgi:undecaprenyl-diphosphatase
MLSPAAMRRRLPGLFVLARREIGPIALVMVVGACLLAFRHIAEEVGEGDTRAFDRTILYALRTPGDLHRPIGPAWLNIAAMDVTSLGSVTVLGIIVVLVAGLFLSFRRWREALALLLASGGGLLITNLLKDWFQRDRPPAALHVVQAINASFPSGHATLSATVFLTLGALIAHFAERRRVRVYALAAAVILSVLVGCSRVYLGVHWPTDVLAGWCLGSAWALLWWGAAIAWERINHRRLSTGAVRRLQPEDGALLSESG